MSEINSELLQDLRKGHPVKEVLKHERAARKAVFKLLREKIIEIEINFGTEDRSRQSLHKIPSADGRKRVLYIAEDHRNYSRVSHIIVNQEFRDILSNTDCLTSIEFAVPFGWMSIAARQAIATRSAEAGKWQPETLDPDVAIIQIGEQRSSLLRAKDAQTLLPPLQWSPIGVEVFEPVECVGELLLILDELSPITHEPDKVLEAYY